MSRIVTIRIDDNTMRRIKRHRIPVSEVARTAILREIERREHERALEAVKRMKEILENVDVKRIVKHLREDRLQR